MQSSAVVKQANNSIHLTSNGALLVLLSGYQDQRSVSDLLEQLDRYITTMRSENKPIPVLLDLSRIQGIDPTAKQHASRILSLDFDALAVYKAPPDIAATINEVVSKANQKGRVRTFKAVDEASRWLANFLLINAGV